MNSSTNGPTLRRRRRQITLAGLMSLMLASSAYFAMIAAIRAGFGPRGAFWPIPVAVIIAWCLLWQVYRWWGLRQALVVHLAGPVMALGLTAVIASVGAMAMVADFPPRVPPLFEFVQVALALVLVGGAISSAVSLPAAVLMMLYLCLSAEIVPNPAWDRRIDDFRLCDVGRQSFLRQAERLVNGGLVLPQRSGRSRS